MEQFDDNLCEILIEEVRLHPCLWERTHGAYKDLKAKEAAWVDIGRNMNIHDVHCKRKWTSLRDLFVKSFKTQSSMAQNSNNNSNNGGSRRGSNNPKWKFFHNMYFLADNLNPRVITEYNIAPPSGDSASSGTGKSGDNLEDCPGTSNDFQGRSSSVPAISVKQEISDLDDDADDHSDQDSVYVRPPDTDPIPLGSSIDGLGGVVSSLESPPESSIVPQPIPVAVQLPQLQRPVVKSACWPVKKQVMVTPQGQTLTLKRRKEETDDELLIQSPKIPGSTSSTDHDTIYGNYVAATIAKFPRRIKARAKMRIMEVLLQAEEETEFDAQVQNGNASTFSSQERNGH